MSHYPKTRKELNGFIEFMRMMYLSIGKRKGGYLFATQDNEFPAHCHTRVAKFIQIHGQKHLDDVVVVVGSPGRYEVAHSLVVNREESAILADSMTGYFRDGKYVASIAGHSHTYVVYAAYKIESLIELSRVEPEVFETALMKLRTAKFKGLNIPVKGQVLIRTAKETQ